MELEARPFALRQCVDSAVQSVRVEAQKKRVKIAEVVHARVPDNVRGDGDRVREILVNLLSDAVTSTPSGGQVAILVTSQAADAVHEIRFAVTEGGRGSTFTFTLRVPATGMIDAGDGVLRKAGAPDDAAGTTRLPVGMSDEHPLRILVAEDNPVTQIVLRMLLTRLGYTAEFVANGMDAITAVERAPYDVVFMDVHMPVLDGLAATRELRRAYPANRRPRIVMLAAHPSADDRRQAELAGMDDYLATPLTLDAIVAALRHSTRVETQPERALRA